MTVVAEGVEDAATAARLTELGCPLAQGFHFGRPEPVAVLAARLAELASVVPAA
jgi:EAL domain-containing protein (putative c-di-GMP-specific phosphodiesterase class I)